MPRMPWPSSRRSLSLAVTTASEAPARGEGRQDRVRAQVLGIVHHHLHVRLAVVEVVAADPVHARRNSGDDRQVVRIGERRHHGIDLQRRPLRHHVPQPRRRPTPPPPASHTPAHTHPHTPPPPDSPPTDTTRPFTSTAAFIAPTRPPSDVPDPRTDFQSSNDNPTPLKTVQMLGGDGVADARRTPPYAAARERRRQRRRWAVFSGVDTHGQPCRSARPARSVWRRSRRSRRPAPARDPLRSRTP